LKVINICIIAILSFFIGCGSPVDNEEFNINTINEIQESLEVEVGKLYDESLPVEIRKNEISKHGDEGYSNGN